MLPATAMTEYQKAAVDVIREVSVQLILIAVGAMSVAGSVLGTRTQQAKGKGRLKVAMTLLSLSVLVGVVTLGSLMAQLSAERFDLYQPTMRYAYLVQLLTTFFGGAFLAWFLAENVL
jgi:hypothetical protein